MMMRMPRATAPLSPQADPKQSHGVAEVGGTCRFSASVGSIRIAGWGLIGAALDTLTPHWPHRLAGAADGPEPVHVSVIADKGGYRVVTPGGNVAALWFADPLSAAHAAAGALIEARLAREPDALAVHAAAVVMGNRALVLMGASQSGKSTLALHLAAAGRVLLGDDRILLSAHEPGVAAIAIALGLAPKVRLPVPHDLGPRFRNFVAARENGRDDAAGAAFLALMPGEQAAHGERVPVAALIHLSRQNIGPTRIFPISRSQAVRAIIDQGAAPHLPGGAILALAAKISARVPTFTLSYSSSRRAADALIARFGKDFDAE